MTEKSGETAKKAAPGVVGRCPECGETDDLAVLCFEGESTRFVCNNCEHEWKEADE